jgi:N-acetyl-anhydromuramyl-L-alanine amidase AmpD
MPTSFTRIVRNRSSRHGVTPRVIILHTTEGTNKPGLQDLNSLVSWFDNPAAQASSHVGIDAEGNLVRMVPDNEKAWTSGNFNPQSLNIEQVGFARTSKKSWIVDYHEGLHTVAWQLADWSIKYSIPLRHSIERGVCQHVHVSGPGGHTDCGPGYPEQYVVAWARLLRWRKKGRPDSGREKAQAARQFVERVQREYAGRVLGT